MTGKSLIRLRRTAEDAGHIGRNYGSKNLFGRYGNRNSIAVEMCVQKGYDYETAFLHTVELVKNLMNETGIPSDAVYRHYDICSKNCPSQIEKRGDGGACSSVCFGKRKTAVEKVNTILASTVYQTRH